MTEKTPCSLVGSQSYESFDPGSQQEASSKRFDINQVDISSVSQDQLKDFTQNVKANNKVENIQSRAEALKSNIDNQIIEARSSFEQAKEGKVEIDKKTFIKKIGTLALSITALVAVTIATGLTGGIASPFIAIAIALANVAICAGDAYCAYQSVYNGKQFACGNDSVANFFSWLDTKFEKQSEPQYHPWMTAASVLIRGLCMCTNPLVFGSCYGPSQKFDIGLSRAFTDSKLIKYRVELELATKNVKMTDELSNKVEKLKEQLMEIEESANELSEARNQSQDYRTEFYNGKYMESHEALKKSENKHKHWLFL